MSNPEEETATSNDPKQQERDDAAFSPGAGCIIIIMILALFSGVAFFAIYSGLKQDKDIVRFTEEKALELPDEPGTPEEVAAVREKFATFTKTIRENEPATLQLTCRDINILIHNNIEFKEIRDMIYFDSVTPEAITGRTAWPLRRLFWWKPNRYMNGTITLKLEASRGRLFLRLVNIDSPGNEIPEGFIERIAQDDLLNPYKNEDNEDVYESIDSATMNDGSVTIVSKPVEGKKK